MKGVNADFPSFRDDRVARLQTVRTPEQAHRGSSAELHTIAGSLRFTGELGRFAYLGIETAFGAVQVHNWTSGVVHIDESDSAYYHAGMVTGVLIHSGRLVVRGEAFGGFRTLELLATHATRGTTRSTESEGVLEARMSSELWLAPWTTLGALIGTDLVHRTIVFGGALTLYSSAFDDSRRRRDD